MRVKEVVLDQGEGETEVVRPPNLMLFPHQWIIVIWWIITSVFLLVGGIWWYAENLKGIEYSMPFFYYARFYNL